jgi:tetratricopeptide (TPR) repeat protein
MPDSLELEAGQSLSIPIRVERAGRDEPLVIHFEGLPAGVTICDVSIPAGRNQSRAMARARLDAAAQTVPVAMTISAGSALVRAEFRLEVRANPAMLHRTRGHTLLACGRPAEAIAAFTKALEAGVSDPLVYNNRGMAHFALNQLDLAIRDYTEASRLSPSDAVIRYNRGVALERRGDDFRALLDFDTAIRLKPDYARAYEARASIYRKQGDLARAGADSGRASALAQSTHAEGQPPAPCPPRPHASAGSGPAERAANPSVLSR